MITENFVQLVNLEIWQGKLWWVEGWTNIGEKENLVELQRTPFLSIKYMYVCAAGAFNQSIFRMWFSNSQNVGLNRRYVWGAMVCAFVVASVVIEFVQKILLIIFNV